MLSYWRLSDYKSTQKGEIYVIKAGDLVKFPAMLYWEWEVSKSIKNIICWVVKFKGKDFLPVLLLSQWR